MDRLNKKIVKIGILTILCICFFTIIIKSKAEFIILNTYIIIIFLSIVVMVIYEIISMIFLNRIKKDLKLLKLILPVLLSGFVIFSFFLNKTEKITNDNSDSHIDHYINMNDFIGDSNIIINTLGESHKTLFTKKYCSYMTGSNYEKSLPVVGVKNDYIEFKKNYISGLLLNKYFEDKIAEHKYIEENGMFICEENILNETQLYIIIKRNSSICLAKIYTKNDYEKSEIIKIILKKADSFM